MKRIGILIVIMSSFLISCTTTQNLEDQNAVMSQETKNRIQSIESWSIGFEYENQTIERTIENDIVVETIIKDHGYSDLDLEMRDNICFQLQNNQGISLSKVKRDDYGQINIHFTLLTLGSGWAQAYVRLFYYDQNDDLLYEERISNHSNSFRFNDLMPKIVNAIARTIQ